MHDRSISAPSANTPFPQATSGTEATMTTTSLTARSAPAPNRFTSDRPSLEPPERTDALTPGRLEADYVGLTLWSGTGERLGVVVHIENDRFGQPKHLTFLEPGATHARRVPLRVVRRVDEDGIHLAGPRQGYHITRLG